MILNQYRSKRRDFGGDYRPRFGRALRAPSSELKFRAIEQVGGDFTKFPPAGKFFFIGGNFKMAPPTVRLWTTAAESKLADFLRGKASQMTRGILADTRGHRVLPRARERECTYGTYRTCAREPGAGGARAPGAVLVGAPNVTTI